MKEYIVLLFQFIFYFAYIIFADILTAYLLDISGHLQYYKFTVNIIIYTPVLVFFFFLNRYSDYSQWEKISPNFIIVIIASVILLRILEDPFFRFRNIFLDESIDISTLYSQKMKAIEFIGYFLGSVVLAPIVEELFFRKYMINRLIRKGYMISIILPSLLYAIIHTTFPNFLLSFFMGLILSLFYVKHKDIRYTILFHSAYNFLWLLLNIFSKEYWLVEEALEFGYLYWGIIIVSTLLLFFMLKQLLFSTLSREDL